MMIHERMSSIGHSSSHSDPDSLFDPADNAASPVRMEDLGALALDVETLEQLGLAPDIGNRLVGVVTRALAHLLAGGQSVEIAAFGKFQVRPFRTACGSLSDGSSLVEVPYLGAIEFSPSALVQRQIDADKEDPSQIARCDALFSTLRDNPAMPRGKIPLLIKGTFQAIVHSLLKRHLAALPALGFMLLRFGPGRFTMDLVTRQIVALPRRRVILFRPQLSVVQTIPGLAIGRAPTPAPSTPPVLTHLERADHLDEP